MDVFILLYIVTVAFTAVTGQQVVMQPKVYSSPGQTVNLSCVFTDATGVLISQVSWIYETEGRRINIAAFVPNNAPAYPESPLKDRVNFSPSPPVLASPSIQIRDVKKTDEGKYMCSFGTLAGTFENVTNLEMLAPVSNVTLTASSTDLVEFSSVRLSCSSSGSLPSFLWLNSSSEVTASDRVHITDEGSTLTIVSVTRYDQGPFRCHVFNPVSNGTSDPVKLSISFGPENTRLTKSPSQVHYEEGSNISLTCSADSRPTAQFTWFWNSEPMADTGSDLRLNNVKESQSGNYSCQAFNNKTMRNETSQPSVISVLKKIVNASVTPSTNQTVEGNSVNLTCEAAGSVFSRKWMKNGAELTESDNMMFYNEGRVLTFLSLKKTDRGQYSCNISNPLSSDEAKYDMLVYFGPENVHIQGPSTLSVNEILTLTCSAESIPPPTFTWKLNETVIPCTSAVLKKNITDVSESGKYICEVMNGVTGRHSSAVHELTVTLAPGPRPKPRCPAGCIAGSVIGCLVFIALCGVLVFVLLRKKKMQKKTSKRDTSTRTGGEGQTNAAFPGNQEVNYADVRFYRNRDGGTVNLGTENNTSEYAQVRVNSRPAAASSLPTYDAHMQRTTAPAHLSGAYGAQQYAQVRK